MEDTKPKKSLIKRIGIITLILPVLVVLIYVAINIVFWKKGMPERYFEYTILENDTVEIKHYTGSFFLLNIPDTIEGKPVTSIGYHIMWDKDSNALNWFSLFITSVHLPDTVEEIHDYAFSNFTNLRTINIPSNLKRTGILILQDTKVTKLVFPEGITEIGCCGQVFDNKSTPSFAYMKYLREVQFPESLKKIGYSTFRRCTSLKKVTLPEGIEEIYYGAFGESGLTEVNIPKSLVNCEGSFLFTPFEETLKKEASDGFIIFNDVLLYKYIGSDENIVIPDGVERICDRVFHTGKKIKTVEIPESMKYINLAFQYSLVENVKLPNSIKVIDSYAFSNCIALEDITIPEGVEEIGDRAFIRCEALKKIVIPASVKHIDDHAFSECTSLEEVIIEGSPDMGDDVFAGCEKLVNKPE